LVGAVKHFFSLALTLSVISSSLAPVLACGPFFDEANFSYANNPDLPLKKYLSGRLGIVEPTFAKSYLVVAYRYLNGKTLTPFQQAAVQALILNRLDLSGQRTNLTTTPAPQGDAVVSGLSTWKAAHNKVPGVTAVQDITTTRQSTESNDGMGGDFFLNCPDDAFASARVTLQNKISKHGLDSAFVKSWTAAQDQVFCHCSSPEYDWKTKKTASEPSFPQLAPKETDSEAKCDRMYQIAAAHFYAKQFDLAFKEFSEIAADSASPYAAISSYMTARCLIRKATLTTMDKAAQESTFDSAAHILSELCANSGAAYKIYHHSAQSLLAFINCRIHPDQQLNTLGRILAETSDDKNFQQDLDDYTTLLDKIEGVSEDYYDPPKTKLTTPKTAAEDDLTQWMTAYQLGSSAEQQKFFETAEREFQKTHSNAWLLVALSLAPLDKNKSANLINAAKSVTQASPAYLSINYAVAKILISSNEIAVANSLISALETDAHNQQLPSAVNLLMDLRAKMPMNTGDFVANSVRMPASYSVDFEYFDPETMPHPDKAKKIAPAFAFANADYINKSLPLSVLADICDDAKLPSSLKLNLAQATFVRAILLDDNAALKKSSDVLMSLSSQTPALKSVKRLLPAIKAASGPEQKFAAAYMILQNPGMEPFVTPGAQRQDALNVLNEYNDNWWLDPPTSDPSISQAAVAGNAFLKLPNFPGLLTASQKAKGLAEKKKIAQLGAGSSYLGAIVCEFARTHQTDSRVPEALALAVRASHYGITDKSTTKYSKQAFELLHKNYPQSPFTARTKYHY